MDEQKWTWCADAIVLRATNTRPTADLVYFIFMVLDESASRSDTPSGMQTINLEKMVQDERTDDKSR